MEGSVEVKFYNYYKSFLQDIIMAFPEYKEGIIENHASLLRSQYPISEKKQAKCKKWRQTVFEYVSKYGKQISEKDSIVFLSEEACKCLGRNIDFKTIWESNVSDTSREQLWNYVQTFYMLAISENTDNDLSTLFKNFNEVLDGKDNQDMVDHLKNITENMMGSINKEKEELSEEKKGEIDGQADKIKSEFDGIFNGSLIGDLANDISKELDIEKMLGDTGNPQDLIANLFGGGGGGGPNIMSIVENIGKSINDKVQSGELDEMKLVHEAQNIMGNLQNNEMFSGLTQGLSQSMQQMGQQSAPVPRNPTQERLQKKINKKKENKD